MSYHKTEIGGAIDSTHIYYNIAMTNNFTDGQVVFDVSGNPTSLTQLPTDKFVKQLYFNELRTSPYLVNPSEYFMSVARFTVQTPNLPILIAQPIVGQSNVNLLIYKITFVDQNGAISSGNLLWNQRDYTIKPPPTPVSVSAQTDPYYYCYTVYDFQDIVNGRLNSLGGYPGTNTPYIIFDETTNLWTMGAPLNMYRTSSNGSLLGDTTLATRYKIYFNAPLYNLFSSLPSIYANLGNGLDYQILFSTGSDVPYSSTQPYITNVAVNNRWNTNYINTTQEYCTMPLWSPVKSIVFNTQLLSVVPEMVGQPYVISSTTQNPNVYTQNASIENILIDHIIPTTTGFDGKVFLYYEPTGEYRLSDLYGNTPIQQIQIVAYWKDWQNNLHPLLLSLGCSATIKLLFRKKSFNSELL